MKMVILAAGSGERFRATGESTPKPLVRLGGLPLLERTARSAAKAGAEEIVIVVGSQAERIQNELAARLADIPVRWVVNEQWQLGNGTSVLAAAPHVGPDPFLVLMTDHLIFPKTLKKLIQATRSARQTHLAVDFKTNSVADLADATKVSVQDGSIVALNKNLTSFNAIDIGAAVCTRDFIDALKAAQGFNGGPVSHSDGMRGLIERGALRAFDIGADRWEDADTPETLAAAERVLFQSLSKSTDGFMSRLLERRLSGWVTRRLMNTGITPNQVTLGIVALGAVAAFAFAQPGTLPKGLGALLFWCSSFLDGVDGELARLKFQETRLGGWLDLWSDNVVHMLVFSAMGVGLWRDTGNADYVRLGLAAAFGVLMSVAWVSWSTVRKKKGDGPLYTSVAGEGATTSPWRVRLTRLADALSRRDFIFGVIFLAWLGWLGPFLWAAAIGSNLYWMLLMLLTFTRRNA